MLNLAYILYYWVRVRSGWVAYSMEPDFLLPMIAICVYWIIVFFFFGLYQSWYAKSRFDELTTIFKATIFGALVLFFAIFVDDSGV